MNGWHVIQRHFRDVRYLLAGFAIAATVSCDGQVSSAECETNSSCPQGFVCLAQVCRLTCTRSEECGEQASCADGICQEGACARYADCQSPGTCALRVGAMCEAAKCIYPVAPDTTPCDDGNACTDDDVCVEQQCHGTPHICDAPPNPSCADADQTYVTYPSEGSCDPSVGECVYDPVRIACANCAVQCLSNCGGVSCPDQAGGCRTDGSCNPNTGACDYTTLADGEPCNIVSVGDGRCQSGSCVAATYAWVTAAWSSCSVTCGTGGQSRTVTCQRTGDGATVADSLCPSPKPALTQSCTSTSWCDCPLDWLPGPVPTIANGESGTFYQANSVACGQTCVSQVRVCNQGVLSGSYQNLNCTVQACAPQIIISTTLDAPSADPVNRGRPVYARVTNLTATNAQSCIENVGIDDGYCATLSNWTTKPSGGWTYDSYAYLWRTTTQPYAFPARQYRQYWRNTITLQQGSAVTTLC